ncbi:hypothetical protein CR513_04440, partial [Mucuna pruriens]
MVGIEHVRLGADQNQSNNTIDNQLYEPEQMENNNRTLKELATPDVVGDIGRLYQDEGLMMMDMNMIDAASGGVLMDKTPIGARHLISNMANNTHQFGTRGGVTTSRVVNKVSTIENLRLENQLTELTSLVDISIGDNRSRIDHMIVNNIRGSSISESESRAISS